jgi:hypothetical protein
MRSRVPHQASNAIAIVAGKRQKDLHRRGWRGWRKHVARRWRILKPDDLLPWIGMWLVVAVCLAGLYFAGTIGAYAALALVALFVFVGGVVTRAVQRVVRAARSRMEGS